MTEWKRVGYIKTSDRGPFSQHEWRYHLELPRPLADWDVFDYWERPRTESIANTLKRGDVLYDVGTENGWLSVVYAQTVGPENMVLIEPSKVMWPNIAQTWGRNFAIPRRGGLPLATCHALISDTADGDLPEEHLSVGYWPEVAVGELTGPVAYTYLHDESGADTPVTTIDRLARQVGRPPAGITIDVEGAELLVLRGAESTLRTHRPHVWVSIHPDLMARDYGATPQHLFDFMAGLGYAGTHLSTDHEQHWHFEAQP